MFSFYNSSYILLLKHSCTYYNIMLAGHDGPRSSARRVVSAGKKRREPVSRRPPIRNDSTRRPMHECWEGVSGGADSGVGVVQMCLSTGWTRKRPDIREFDNQQAVHTVPVPIVSQKLRRWNVIPRLVVAPSPFPSPVTR